MQTTKQLVQLWKQGWAVFKIQNTILYFNTFEKNQMYFVFKLGVGID